MIIRRSFFCQISARARTHQNSRSFLSTLLGRSWRKQMILPNFARLAVWVENRAKNLRNNFRLRAKISNWLSLEIRDQLWLKIPNSIALSVIWQTQPTHRSNVLRNMLHFSSSSTCEDMRKRKWREYLPSSGPTGKSKSTKLCASEIWRTLPYVSKTQSYWDLVSSERPVCIHWTRSWWEIIIWCSRLVKRQAKILVRVWC